MALDHPYFVERTSCPCCGCCESDTLYECALDEDPMRQYLKNFYASPGGVEFEYLRGARFELRRCRACTLLYQAQIGNEFLLKKLYEQWIDPSLARECDQRRRDLRFHLKYAREIITVLAHLDKSPAETRVLDFGMGWGRWCRMARGFGCQVYGTELSEERMEFARSQGISVISSEEIPGGRFDFINAEQVFEHLAEPLATLRRLVAGLAADGLIKISVPNGKWIPRRLERPDWTAPRGSRRSLGAVAPLEHVNCFNHKSLVTLAGRAELTPVELKAETHIDVSAKRGAGWKRLGRAIAGLIPASLRRRRGTSLFFRRS